MSKIGFLFVGQGAQYPGMGQELYDEFDVCKKVYQDASQSIGMDLGDLCFNGDKDQLNKTENTQPAIVTTSLAAFMAISEYGIQADALAGLSLGEYSALTASGVFELVDVIPLVQKRGIYMQEAVPPGQGKMIAILGLSAEKISEACQEASDLGLVEIANYNCPGQIVIAGQNIAVDKAAEIAMEKGGKRSIELPVSAPFHTSLLKPAADKLLVDLKNIPLMKMKTPLVSNLTGQYNRDSQEIVNILYKQVMNSVLWEQSIRTMIKDGITEFVEIGPGRSLSSFVRKIDPKVRTHNVQDLKSLGTTVSKLKK